MAPPESAFRLLPRVVVLVLVVVVLRGCAGAPISVRTPHDPHCLRCDFNITSNKQPRCMAQCLMGRMDLLLYDCDNDEVKYVNNMLKGTQTLEGMTNVLKETGDSTRGKLPDLTPEKYTKKDSPTLQVRLMCQCAANGSCSELWEFRLPGQWSLVFHPKSGKYEADNSSGEQVKKKWENDEGMNGPLKTISMGDCKRWLNDLVDRKEERETTAASTIASASASPPTVSATPTMANASASPPAISATPTMANASASPPAISATPTMANASASPPTVSATPTMATTAASPSKALIIITLIIITLIIIFIGLGILVWKIDIKRRCCSGVPESGSSSTCVPSGRPPCHPPPPLTCDLQELQPLQPPEDRGATADATFVSSTV